jgi:Zn-dependent protease with chaperone function
MKSYILALGTVILVICVCVLVTQYEARQTWESMRQMAKDELPKLVQQGLESSKVQTAEEKSEDILNTLKSAVGGGKGSKGKPAAADAPVDGNDKPSNGSAADGILGTVRDTIGLPPDKLKPIRPADAIDEIFGKVQDVVTATEQNASPYVQLSISEERALGRKFHEEAIREYDVVKDSALYDRIDELAAPILRGRRRRGIDYTFTVVKSDPEDINAFSMIGGYVYFHSAAIAFFKTDDALQSVIGHEIGHVDLGHCAHSVGVAQSVGSFGGSFAAGMHAMLARPYSQVQEYEADEYGFRAQIAAGRTREQALEGPREFARYFRLRGTNQPTKKKSDHSVVGTLIEDTNSYFRTHPYEDNRVKRLEAIQIDSQPGQ